MDESTDSIRRLGEIIEMVRNQRDAQRLRRSVTALEKDIAGHIYEPHDFGFSILFFYMVEGCVIANATTGKIVLINPAGTRIFGYSPEEALGMDLRKLVPEEFRERHDRGVARYAAIGHGDLIDSGQLLNLVGLHKSGAKIPVWLALVPAATPVGSEGRFVMGLVLADELPPLP